jgi:dephospho-CoA kinase
MKTIGLVGGIASGKSLVAKLLAEHGAVVLDADRAGHQALSESPAIERALHEHWGDAVFTSDGSVDRRAIAERVFAIGGTAETDRRFLESLLHPEIRRRLKDELAAAAAAGKQVAVLDAALLFEAGWRTLCDLVIFVDAPREARLARALSRGWTEPEFAAREAAQWPIEEKRREADVIISNDASEAELRQAVAGLWDRYTSA